MKQESSGKALVYHGESARADHRGVFQSSIALLSVRVWLMIKEKKLLGSLQDSTIFRTEIQQHNRDDEVGHPRVQHIYVEYKIRFSLRLWPGVSPHVVKYEFEFSLVIMIFHREFLEKYLSALGQSPEGFALMKTDP